MVRTLLLLIAATFAVRAQPSAIVTGTVIDSATRLPVHALMTPSGGTRDVTAADGSFTLYEVPAGEVNLHIAAVGYRSLDASLKISDGEHKATFFELHPMARVTGKVVDKVTGQPIVRSILIENQGRLANVGNSGKDGTFEFASLEPGDYRLKFDATEGAVISWDPEPQAKSQNGQKVLAQFAYAFIAYPETVHLAEGEQKSLIIRLTSTEARSVAGSLEFPPGVDEATVSIGYGSIDGGLNDMKVLGKHRAGSFRIDGLIPAMYRIYARIGEGAGRSYGAVSTSISDHDVDGLTIKLTPGISVTGSIRMLEDDTVLPPSTPGLLALLLSSSNSGTGITDPMTVEGMRFHAEGMAQGDYWPDLLGLPNGYAVTDILFGNAPTLGKPISLYGAGEVTFVVTSKAGSVLGTVRDRNQAPVKGMQVTLVPRSTSDPQYVRGALSGEAGDFRFRDLAPGWYTIEGAPPIEVKPNQTVTITLTR